MRHTPSHSPSQLHHSAHRAAQQGLSLIELMVTFSLVVLFVVLLVSALRPNPQQRCKAEALRLAAYLEATASEAKMSGGLSRAQFTFSGPGEAQRQVTEMRVEQLGISWVNDERAEAHKIEAPVKLDTVHTHLLGEVKSGEAQLIFKGSATSGGVAVLALKEVLYSVVVPPDGGPIEVKPGRSPLPPAYQGPDFKRSAMRSFGAEPNVEGSALSGSGSGLSSSASSLSAPPTLPSLPPRRSPPSSPPDIDPGSPDSMGEDPIIDDPSPDDEPGQCGDGRVDEGEECDDGNDDDQDGCLNSCVKATCGDGVTRLDLPIESGGEACDDGNDLDTDACTNTCKEAVCGDGILREGVDPRDVGYEECDDGNLTPGDGCNAQCQTECLSDADCQAPEEKGPWGSCDQATATCKLSLPAFRLESISSVTLTDGGITANLEQPALARELQNNLQSWINQGKLIMVVSLGEFGQRYEYAHEVPSAYFFQGQLSGVTSVMSRQDLPVYNYQPSYYDCSANGVFEHCFSSSKAIISLYIPFLGTATCDYQVLTLNTTLSLNVTPGQRAQVTLTGYLTPRDARLFKLTNTLTLADALDGVEPSVDCNGDPKKEAWAITIAGEATEKELSSPPIGSPPSGCYTGGGGDDCNPPPDDEELQALLDAECVRCHNDDRAEGSLSLTEPFRDKVVRQPSITQEGRELVRPGYYEDSLMYELAGQAHGGQQNPMPPSGVTRLKEWILGL